jgi:hypothetical protein
MLGSLGKPPTSDVGGQIVSGQKAPVLVARWLLSNYLASGGDGRINYVLRIRPRKSGKALCG